MYIMEKTSYQILLDIRIRIYRMIHYLPTEDYNQKTHGDITSRILDDCNKIKLVIYLNFESLLPNALTLVGIIGYLFYLNWFLASISLISPGIFLYAKLFSKRLRKVSKQLQQNTVDLTK